MAAVADERDEKPSTPTKVVIVGGGVSVTIESAEPLDPVTERAQQLHREAHERCVGKLPAGFGGAL